MPEQPPCSSEALRLLREWLLAFAADAHSMDCGTAHRGCAPRCLKDRTERLLAQQAKRAFRLAAGEVPLYPTMTLSSGHAPLPVALVEHAAVPKRAAILINVTGGPPVNGLPAEGPPEPRWQVWKKRYMDGWMTHDRYRHVSGERAERQAKGFAIQMSVVDVAVMPIGQTPEG